MTRQDVNNSLVQLLQPLVDIPQHQQANQVMLDYIDAKSSTVDWTNITDKPLVFAPAAHTHAISDVVDLQSILDGKSPNNHTHGISQISGLQPALNAKVTIPANPLEGYVLKYRSGAIVWDTDMTATGTTGGSVDWADVTNKPSLFPPSAHTHLMADITDLAVALMNKSDVGHLHAISNVVNLQSVLDGKQPLGNYAPLVHTHNISDVIGLQAQLNAKQAILTPYNGLSENGTYIGLGGTLSQQTDIVTSVYPFRFYDSTAFNNSFVLDLANTGLLFNFTDKYTTNLTTQGNFQGDYLKMSANNGTNISRYSQDGNSFNMEAADVATNSPFFINVNQSTGIKLGKGTWNAGVRTDKVVLIDANANVSIDSLKGSTTQMVVADANGKLGVQAIPTGSSYTFGNGLTSIAGAVSLGGSLTQDTTIDAAGFVYQINEQSGNNTYTNVTHIDADAGIPIHAKTFGLTGADILTTDVMHMYSHAFTITQNLSHGNTSQLYQDMYSLRYNYFNGAAATNEFSNLFVGVPIDAASTLPIYGDKTFLLEAQIQPTYMGSTSTHYVGIEGLHHLTQGDQNGEIFDSSLKFTVTNDKVNNPTANQLVMTNDNFNINLPNTAFTLESNYYQLAVVDGGGNSLQTMSNSGTYNTTIGVSDGSGTVICADTGHAFLQATGQVWPSSVANTRPIAEVGADIQKAYMSFDYPIPGYMHDLDGLSTAFLNQDGFLVSFTNTDQGTVLSYVKGLLVDASGVSMDSLKGVDSRMVIADSTGKLSTQALPTPYNFQNGLVNDGAGNIGLGGTLSGGVAIDGNVQTFNITNLNSFAITGTDGQPYVLGITETRDGAHLGIQYGNAFVNIAEGAVNIFPGAGSNNTFAIDTSGVAAQAVGGDTSIYQVIANTAFAKIAAITPTNVENSVMTDETGVTISTLKGTGTRMVVADDNGLLSTQDIPSGGGSSNTFTNGLAVITGSTVGLGGSLSQNTTIDGAGKTLTVKTEATMSDYSDGSNGADVLSIEYDLFAGDNDPNNYDQIYSQSTWLYKQGTTDKNQTKQKTTYNSWELTINDYPNTTQTDFSIAEDGFVSSIAGASNASSQLQHAHDYLNFHAGVNNAYYAKVLAQSGTAAGQAKIDLWVADDSTVLTHGSRVTINDSSTTIDTPRLNVKSLPTYADDTAATSGGLTSGDLYKTATGALMIKL